MLSEVVGFTCNHWVNKESIGNPVLKRFQWFRHPAIHDERGEDGRIVDASEFCWLDVDDRQRDLKFFTRDTSPEITDLGDDDTRFRQLEIADGMKRLRHQLQSSSVQRFSPAAGRDEFQIASRIPILLGGWNRYKVKSRVAASFLNARTAKKMTWLPRRCNSQPSC